MLYFTFSDNYSSPSYEAGDRYTDSDEDKRLTEHLAQNAMMSSKTEMDQESEVGSTGSGEPSHMARSSASDETGAANAGFFVSFSGEKQENPAKQKPKLNSERRNRSTPDRHSSPRPRRPVSQIEPVPMDISGGDGDENGNEPSPETSAVPTEPRVKYERGIGVVIPMDDESSVS